MPILRGFDELREARDVSTGTIVDVMNDMTEVDERLALYSVRRSAHTRAMVYYSADSLLPLFLQQIRGAKRQPYFGFVNLIDALRNFEGDVMRRRLGLELAHPETISDPARRA